MEAVPAPFWFVQFFKVVGFVLHTIPMGIWFAGLPVVILCVLKNGKCSRFYARRMSAQLPVMMALGINFGIVPLLFLQTTYYKAFFTATILTAWYWLAIIPLVIIAYYSIYIAAYSGERRSRMILFSTLASVCLLCVATLFTNGLTLMVCSGFWSEMATNTSYYGAVLGTAHCQQYPELSSILWLRLATMFGLGLLTAGVWATFDSHFLMRSQAVGVPANYRQWTTTLALVMAFFGAAILTYTEWHVKTVGGSLIYPYFGCVLAAAYAVVFVLLLSKTGSALVVGFAAALQFLTLAAFGIIRQIGQNDGMAMFLDVSQLPEAVQWTPLLAFLAIFLLGVGVIVWMVVQCVKCADNPDVASHVPVKTGIPT